MSARDELQKVIFGYFGPTLAINAYRTPEQQDRGLADAIIAAGYRKPRTITTAEELDALPVGSVVKDEDGHAHLKYPRGWVRTGQEPYSTPEGILPAIVIHEASGE